MGEFANTRLTNALAIAATGFVCLLNGILLPAIVGIPLPFAGALTVTAEKQGASPTSSDAFFTASVDSG
jgi:hypothetical protein